MAMQTNVLLSASATRSSYRHFTLTRAVDQRRRAGGRRQTRRRPRTDDEATVGGVIRLQFRGRILKNSYKISAKREITTERIVSLVLPEHWLIRLGRGRRRSRGEGGVGGKRPHSSHRNSCDDRHTDTRTQPQQL